MRLPTFVRRSISAAALAVFALLLPLSPVLAAEYSDLWVTAGENAWGVNFVQWDSVIYATMYIYGPDKKPTWYAAVLNRDVSGNFAGTLYFTQGTYFANPWNPGDMLPEANTVAGTASFQPSTTNNYQGTLVYTVNGVGTVSKPLRRFSEHPAIPLAGLYYGGQSGAYTGCTDPKADTPYFDQFSLQATQTGANNLSLSFSFTSDLTCTLAGTLAQNGLLYEITSATYLCSDQLNAAATVTDVKLTAQGIEGRFVAPVVGGGCREEARFSAVRN
jgi:hypothetical protein